MIESFVLLENHALVPPEWRTSEGSFRIFNPSLQKTPNGYCLAYRVVQEGTEHRKLAACQLDASFKIIPDSVIPLSDLIRFQDPTLDFRALEWHADPRYYLLHGRLFLYWNDGANKPINHQFLMEMSADGCRPAGLARELVKTDGRLNIEKNWMLFEAQDQTWAVYSLNPIQILSVNLDAPKKITCQLSHCHYWNSAKPWPFGVLRGSTQPIAISDEVFLNVIHSSYKATEGRKYKASVYTFSSKAPFRVLKSPLVPIELPNPFGEEFEMPKLNADVSEVVYPCGALLVEDQLVVSYGINDERCAITALPLSKALATLAPVEPSETTVEIEPASKPFLDFFKKHFVFPSSSRHYPTSLFWWDAKGLKYDGDHGSRRFDIGNFGDIASKEVVEKITGRRTLPSGNIGPKLLAIGSVIHMAEEGDIVWGSGSKGNQPGFARPVSNLSVHAVRGPKTLEFLKRNGISTSGVKALFDPGCLIPLLYKKEIATWHARPDKVLRDYIVIPHFRDDLILRREHIAHSQHIVSVDQTPVGMIEAILGAKRVISSSLHGLIFAEALGIPALWLAPIGGEDEMKFYDYYYGTERFDVKRFTSVEEAIRAEPMALPTFHFEDYLATFPHKEIAALGSFGLVEGRPVSFSMMSKTVFSDLFKSSNFADPGREGVWATGRRSCLTTSLRTTSSKSVGVRLSLRPFNPPQCPSSQHLKISINGVVAKRIRWQAGMAENIDIVLPLEAEGTEMPLDIHFEAAHAISPSSLGLSERRKRCAFVLVRLEVISLGG